jgi:hypothetical protein
MKENDFDPHKYDNHFTVIVILLFTFLGIMGAVCGCTTTRPVVIEDKVFADCGKCVSEAEFNDCVDQNVMLRKYLTECIKMSKQSNQAIEQCQQDSTSRAWRYFWTGSGIGGGLTGAIVILLMILL